MARPERQMAPPASACVQRSSLLKRAKLIPHEAAMTTAIMVPMVAALKTTATSIVPDRLCLAAGYINNGISGSQGPRTKMVKSTQGVILFLGAGS